MFQNLQIMLEAGALPWGNMKTVRISHLREHGGGDGQAVTALVLAVWNGDSVQFVAGLSHTDAVPIGLVVDHTGRAFRQWSSLHYVFLGLRTYLGNSLLTMSVINTAAEDRRFVDLFVELYDLRNPHPEPALNQQRLSLLNQIQEQSGGPARDPSDT